MRYVHRYLPALRDGAQIQALRQIILRNYFLDAQDLPKRREPGDTGLPPSVVAIVPPYDVSARYARRGETRWNGFLAHVTETCGPGHPQRHHQCHHHQGPRPRHQGPPAILANLGHRNLVSKEHFVDGGYLSVALKQQVAHDHGVGLVGPIRARSTRQSRKGTAFHREAFVIGWGKETVTCPQVKATSRWASPASLAPSSTAGFTVADCRACPVKTSCTRTDARNLAFLPRALCDIPSEARTEQQTRE